MFKSGDIVVFIYNGTFNGKKRYIVECTIGKSYVVINPDGGASDLGIISDEGELYYYDRRRFIPLKEYRKQKLERIYSK